MSSWVERVRSVGQSTPMAIGLLVVANLLPLAGVLWFGWDVAMVLITYWLENGIVGVLNVPKILLARGVSTRVAAQPGGKYTYAVFFSFHYGVFWIAHGVFVFALTGRAFFEVTDPLRAVLGDPQLLLAALVLFASHGASFITNYIGRGEYLTATPDQQMFKPYPRMFALHLSIVLAGAFVISRGEPLFAVVLLVVFKTIVDLFLHLREHTGSKAQGKTGPKGIETTRTG